MSISRSTLAQARRPLPEALLTESTTDIDAEEAGELELEANVAKTAARTGGASSTLIALETEWRIFKELGIRFEPSYLRIADAGATRVRESVGVSGGLALGLWHDFPRGLHLQCEVLGQTPQSGNARTFEPAEAQLPFAADLLGALQRGRWTVRATVGAEAGGASAHAPFHTDLALLVEIVPQERFGFVGLEARADWARDTPVVLAPEIVADGGPLRLPLRLGVALPINVGVESTRASYGLFVRLLWVMTKD